MTNITIPSFLQKPLRFFFSYLLFILYGILGLILLVDLHSVLVATGTLISDLYGLTGFLNTWGFFFLLGIYAVCIALMEHSMNKAAQNGEILRRGLKIFVVEGSLALVVVLTPLVAELLLIGR